MTPDVRVVRGAPDDDELAALVAGLAAGSALAGSAVGPSNQAQLTAQQARRRWLDAAQHLADPVRPGPDAWRWSTRG